MASYMRVLGATGVEGAVIVGKLLEKTEEEAMGGRLGYNAATGEFEDLVKAGVIDPLKVRARLQCCRPRPHKHTQLIAFWLFSWRVESAGSRHDRAAYGG